jgi:hypothetical protein
MQPTHVNQNDGPMTLANEHGMQYHEMREDSSSVNLRTT